MRYAGLGLLLALLVAVGGLLLSEISPGPSESRAQSVISQFERDQLAIETAAGARHEFEIELAKTIDERAQGLMYRRSLAEDAGMLFLYGSTQYISMWMKNTLIPLDMLFIEKDGRIAKIVERTVPQSLKTIGSGGPVFAVLELNAGTAKRLGIRPGDKILHSAFDQAS